ncbi:MAG: shikimate dehydrogenase, partial [Pseudomonadota bacterium]
MKRAAVIGSPVAHSKSPLIHGAWLKQYGVHGDYTRVEVQPDALPAFLDRIRGGEFVGCNVTMPLKAHVARHVDEVLPAARVLGSVNTVWRGDAGRLIATSTDGDGFVGHLDRAAPGWRDGDGGVLVLGAGGAARAIVDALLRTGAGDIAVTNRTVARADELAALFPGKVAVKDWAARGSGLGATSLLINT